MFLVFLPWLFTSWEYGSNSATVVHICHWMVFLYWFIIENVESKHNISELGHWYANILIPPTFFKKRHNSIFQIGSETVLFTTGTVPFNIAHHNHFYTEIHKINYCLLLLYSFINIYYNTIHSITLQSHTFLLPLKLKIWWNFLSGL